MRMALVGRLGNHWTRMYFEFQVNRSCVEASWITVLNCSVMSSSLQPRGLYSPSGSSVHGILQARMLGCHFLLQGIFLSQESNSHLCVSCIASKFFNHWAIVQTKKDSVRLSKDRCLLRMESAVRGAPCLREWSHCAPPLAGSSLSENTAGVQMWQ